MHSLHDFHARSTTARCPTVAFVDGIAYIDDEHPFADIQTGESWTKARVRRSASPARSGRAWRSSGPTTRRAASPITCRRPLGLLARPDNPDDIGFYELGARVPLVVISPWARPHFVSHVARDHTAITRFIEAVFDLPALTARDANSDALLDMFDFEHPPALMHPPKAPSAGKGGCHGDLVLVSDEASYVSASPLTVHLGWTNAKTPHDHDRIGIYKYPRVDGDVPTEMNPIEPLAWSYIGGMGHTPSGAPGSGEVDIDASDVVPGATWPLPPGLWIAYYLPASAPGVDGHTAAASTLLQLTP